MVVKCTDAQTSPPGLTTQSPSGASCVALGKLFCFSGPQFSYLSMGWCELVLVYQALTVGPGG